jgi:1,4-dihydroxy-2-naphthoate octaprenyltransferase
LPETAPDKGLALFVSATRAKVLPVMLAPVAVGAVLAWSQSSYLREGDSIGFPHRTGFFSWGWFIVTLIGASALHLASNVVNDYFDEDSGADAAARTDPSGVATGTGLIASGVLSKRATLRLAAALFGVALACGVALAIARGPLVLLLGGVGFLLAFFYVAPPIRYGYIGRGLGEIGIFIAFGYLPLVGSYYVQRLDITPDAAWASFVPGLLTTLVLFHHHFLHWRADASAGKMTPVAVLGPERSLIISIATIVVAYGLLLEQTIAGLWPPGAVVAVVAAVPLVAAVRRARREPILPNYFQLLGSTLGASVLTSAVLVISLIVRVIVRGGPCSIELPC